MVLLLICGINSSNINDAIKLMNSIFYKYFKEKFGYSEDFISHQLINKYKDMNKRLLKGSLKCLKQSQASPNEIRYVSHLLRNTICTSADVPISEYNHDIRIQTNFWNCVKSKLDSSTSSSPSLERFVFVCLVYICQSFKKIIFHDNEYMFVL